MLKGKKSKIALGALLPLGCIFLLFYALHFPLPTEKRSVVFYSSHNREDLRLITQKAIRSAKQSIVIHTYALTDPTILSLLKQKSHQGITVHITYHAKTAPRLRQLESPHFHLHPEKGKGLMHAKWLIVDETWVLLGTANLTTSSLAMHDNLLVGIYDPDFAQALTTPPPFFQKQIGHQTLTFYLLPGHEGLMQLKASLDQAQSHVAVALFTLTHPSLVESLINLHRRGVQIDLTLDQTSSRGASRQALKRLLEADLSPKRSQGLQLFHHKWALIDDQIFVLGSANWTKAAFTKNKDFILFLSPLTKPQIKYLNKSIIIIKKDSHYYN